jgi:hypothetical protein
VQSRVNCLLFSLLLLHGTNWLDLGVVVTQSSLNVQTGHIAFGWLKMVSCSGCNLAHKVNAQGMGQVAEALLALLPFESIESFAVILLLPSFDFANT